MYCLFLQGYDSLDHTNTKHQPETMELLQEWRALLDGSSNKPGREKLVDLNHLLYLIDTFKSNPVIVLMKGWESTIGIQALSSLHLFFIFTPNLVKSLPLTFKG